MQELGKKEDLFGKENLRSITIFGRPNRMPPLSPSEKVICGYNQGLGERMIVCDNLDEMHWISIGISVKIPE
ncbi:MAG: hypothetical protein NTX82_02970 [Candidatus Parcubacteria bacterium]|nr:hypothetical protein [Candidatus Parcubacteria bacterium]